MVLDQSSNFSDIKFIKRYLGTIDAILDHFSNHPNENGLVGQFDEEGTWPLADWVKDWFTSAKEFSRMGVPKASMDTMRREPPP